VGICSGQLSFEIEAPAPFVTYQGKLRPATCTSFKIQYLYDFVIKLCRQQAIAILNHENVNIRIIGQGDAHHRKYKMLRLGGGQACDQSVV
jgi:hypothetical protein